MSLKIFDIFSKIMIEKKVCCVKKIYSVFYNLCSEQTAGNSGAQSFEAKSSMDTPVGPPKENDLWRLFLSFSGVVQILCLRSVKMSKMNDASMRETKKGRRKGGSGYRRKFFGTVEYLEDSSGRVVEIKASNGTFRIKRSPAFML